MPPAPDAGARLRLMLQAALRRRRLIVVTVLLLNVAAFALLGPRR